MGLDVTYGCFNGAYSSFDRFRDALWRAAYPANPDGWANMEGGTFKAFSEENPSHEPLDYLFYHSDCDGYLDTWKLMPLAERLEEVAPLLDVGGSGHLARLGVRGTALQFAEGLRDAHADGEKVEFL